MAMAYHESSRESVVFGGTNGTSGAHHYGDTWGWDGSTWGEFLVGGPLERYLPAMAYHGGTDALVLFGGFNGDFVDPNEYLSDTWTWAGNSWSAAPIIGPSPQRRAYHGMAQRRKIRIASPRMKFC